MKDQNRIHAVAVGLLFFGVCLFLAMVFGSSSNAQTTPVKFAKTTPAETQAMYREYRGVQIGMTAEETRKKLGEPVFKSDDQDVYVFSPNETAQIAYNPSHKVITISTDYLGGVGAPDYRTVVGTELEDRANGSKYKMIHYDREGFWVSYNKSGTTVPMVTITIQAQQK